MKNIFVLSHASDIDGVGSSALVKIKFNLPTSNLFFTNYTKDGVEYVEKQLKGHFKNGITLYLTDLGVSSAVEIPYERILKAVKKYGGKIFWYDHHPWTDGQVKRLATLCDVAIIGENKNYCATEITHKELGFDDKFTNALIKIVHYSDFNIRPKKKPDYELVGRYALSIASYNIAESPQLMTKKLRHIVDVLAGKKFLDKTIIADAKKFSALNEMRVKEMLANLEITRDFAIGFSKQVQSTYACGAIIKLTKKKIAIYVNAEKGRGSIRSTGPNISELAKSMGGGGHPRASGFSVDPRKFNYFKTKKDRSRFADFIGGKIEKLGVMSTTTERLG